MAYTPWACFIQPIHEPQGPMKEHFTKCQEGAQKDVERAFGVLQARWEIVKNFEAAMGLGDYFEHHDGMHYHAQHDNRRRAWFAVGSFLRFGCRGRLF